MIHLGYIFLVIIFLLVLYVEVNFAGFHNEEKTFQEHNEEEILERVDRNAEEFAHIVYWRRSFLTSVIVCLIIFGLVLSKYSFPSPQVFLLSVISVMLPIYYLFNFYQFHLIKYKTNNIRNATNILRDRKNLSHYY